MDLIRQKRTPTKQYRLNHDFSVPFLLFNINPFFIDFLLKLIIININILEFNIKFYIIFS